MKRILSILMGCMLSTFSGAEIYVYHEGVETVSRVLSVSLSASKDYQVPVLRDLSQLKDNDLVVTVGFESFQTVCSVPAQVSIISLFLGEEEFTQAQSQCAKASTAVFSGAPIHLRLDVLDTFWEDSSPIALIHSSSLTLSQRANQYLQQHEPRVETYAIDPKGREESLKDFADILNKSNLIFSLYDSELFDPEFSKDSIRLLFHKNKALGAHSLQLVRAGALFALYSSSQDKLVLVDSFIRAYLANGALLPPSYPTPLKVAFNPYLIRMYGLVLPTDEYLFNELGVCPESGCQKSLH